MEQELEITTNGDYKNITLKTRVNRATGVVNQGLAVGNHIFVTKEDFEEAFEIDKGSYKLYSCKVDYKGEVVSFLLNRDDEVAEWNNTGGVGDRVKITAVTIPYVFKGEKKTRLGLSFELVE